MPYEKILYDVAPGGVATITLDRNVERREPEWRNR